MEIRRRCCRRCRRRCSKRPAIRCHRRRRRPRRSWSRSLARSPSWCHLLLLFQFRRPERPAPAAHYTIRPRTCCLDRRRCRRRRSSASRRSGRRRHRRSPFVLLGRMRLPAPAFGCRLQDWAGCIAPAGTCLRHRRSCRTRRSCWGRWRGRRRRHCNCPARMRRSRRSPGPVFADRPAPTSAIWAGAVALRWSLPSR